MFSFCLPELLGLFKRGQDRFEFGFVGDVLFDLGDALSHPILEELDRLSATQAEIQSIVAETLKFLAGLEFTLRRGLPQEKLVALRQCIERIHIDKPKGAAKITLRRVPCGNLVGFRELTVCLQDPPRMEATIAAPTSASSES